MTDQKTAQMPRAYRTFADLFAQMDAPLLQVIGGILHALSKRTDTFGSFENQPTGDFVGYDGLESRGALSNLLETEWLLRELDPDDFVRRVAEGEVLFRKRNFQDAGKRNTLAVILDCGPWMLGRNRLVGLAALFHLAIRAERMNADLIWIVPGSQDRDWRHGLTRKTVHRYLGQIVQTPFDHGKIDELLTRLDEVGRLDCWYVGSHQTKHLADHPDVSGAIILRSCRDVTQANTAEITMTHGNRTLGVTGITFEDDATCVAALRRPFKPKVSRTTHTTAQPVNDAVLSSLPFHTDWLFDRLNKAVQVHLDEGVLWQPLMPTQRGDGVWIPIKKGTFLLGLQIDSGKRLLAVIARPSHPHEKGSQVCDIFFYEVDLRRGDKDVQTRGQSVIPVDPANFSGRPVGNLHVVSSQLSLVGNDAVRNTFGVTETKGLTNQRCDDRRILLTNQTYRVHINSAMKSRVEMIGIPRGNLMMCADLIDIEKHLTNAPRHVLCAPHTKVVAISFDGREYEVYGQDGPFVRVIPDGMTLLHLEDATRGLAWNDARAELVKLTFHPDKTRRNTIAKYRGPTTMLPRHCSLTGATLALQLDVNGLPEFVVPIHTKKGWRNITPLKINDAIESARTLWLDS